MLGASIATSLVALGSVAESTQPGLLPRTAPVAEAPSDPSDVPASMSAAAVQVMVELDRPPASVTYAAAYKVAQAEADAARQDALTHPTALAISSRCERCLETG